MSFLCLLAAVLVGGVGADHFTIAFYGIFRTKMSRPITPVALKLDASRWYPVQNGTFYEVVDAILWLERCTSHYD
jgi:hypothetical protein